MSPRLRFKLQLGDPQLLIVLDRIIGNGRARRNRYITHALAEPEAELATTRAELTGAHLLIAQYKAQSHELRRMQFGRSSEALDKQIPQLELKLEDLEESEAARVEWARRSTQNHLARKRRQPVRRPLSDHLPREDIIHAPDEVWPGSGGMHFSKLGEDKTEVLEKIPARLKVIRHIRPKLSCLAACRT
jgi:transposase